MGKVTRWTKLEQARRMAARGSERADGRDAPLVLHAAPKSGARLEAYLSTPLEPLPDPVDWRGEQFQLTPRERWVRDILDACPGD